MLLSIVFFRLLDVIGYIYLLFDYMFMTTCEHIRWAQVKSRQRDSPLIVISFDGDHIWFILKLSPRMVDKEGAGTSTNQEKTNPDESVRILIKI